MYVRIKLNGEYFVVPVVDCPWEMMYAALDGALTYLPICVNGEGGRIAVKMVNGKIECLFVNKESAHDPYGTKD